MDWTPPETSDSNSDSPQATAPAGDTLEDLLPQFVETFRAFTARQNSHPERFLGDNFGRTLGFQQRAYEVRRKVQELRLGTVHGTRSMIDMSDLHSEVATLHQELSAFISRNRDSE